MKFPKTIFVSICGSGDDQFLAANKTEELAIKETDNERMAEVAEYQLVRQRRRQIVITVEDAK